MTLLIAIMSRLPSPRNCQDAVQLSVYEGRSPHLVETRETVLIQECQLPEHVSITGVQKTKDENIFWLLSGARRFSNMCYCCKCDHVFNGSGSNFLNHVQRHGSRRDYSEQDRQNAFVYFLLTHSVGFTAAKDPITTIFLPGISYKRVTSILEEAVVKVRDFIRAALHQKGLSLMIDGWSDQSMRRYVGVAVAYYDRGENRMIHRFLDLNGGCGRDHSAKNQAALVKNVLLEYGVRHPQLLCLCSDSASVNAKIAEELNVEWMPCLLHQWNLIVRRFIGQLPALEDLLSRINKLRQKSRWIEFLAKRSQRRNITGYSPTRWCSACASIESFYDLSSFVADFQRRKLKKPLFTDDDLTLVKEVRNVLRLFAETNDILSRADHQEGLATVFDAVNAIYMVLCRKAEEGGALGEVCRDAATNIEERFFCLDSKYCCRILFAGILNAAHKIPEWLTKILDQVLSRMADELQFFTGVELNTQGSGVAERYSEHSTIQEMIDGSPLTSESSPEVIDEVASFMSSRKTIHMTSFSRFWDNCQRYPHICQLARKLRSFPTNTIWVEQSFSKARRILTWQRMRMTQENAARLCLLYVNVAITKAVLGLGEIAQLEELDDELEAVVECEETEEIFEDDDDTD